MPVATSIRSSGITLFIFSLLYRVIELVEYSIFLTFYETNSTNNPPEALKNITEKTFETDVKGFSPFFTFGAGLEPHGFGQNREIP